MLEQRHLVKLKKFVSSADKGINITQSLLCDIAFGQKFSSDFYKDRKVAQAFSGLRRYKFIRHVKKEGVSNYSLTPKGEARLRTIVIDEIEIKLPRSWDSKWRLVMYDLPIRFKKARNAFRWKLKDLGFFQFQKSAWIYPYPCEREILFVVDFYVFANTVKICHKEDLPFTWIRIYPGAFLKLKKS